MKNTKRALSLLLSLMLVLGAVAVGGMSASAELSQAAWLSIGSVYAIEDGDIKKSEGTDWSITVNEDENSVTLSLDNLNLESVLSCISAGYLDLTITGSAKLTSTGDAFEAICLSDGDLTLNGDFALSAQCETGGALDVYGSLTVEGGSLSVINTDDYAIYVGGAMTVNGGSVYAKTESGSDVYYAISTGITLNNNEAFALGDWNAKEVLISALKGSGVSDSPYEISNYGGLKEFSSIVNGTNVAIAQNTAACAKLMNEIICKNSPDDADYATDWTPIGNYTNQYIGTFDGDGNVITGLSTPAGYNSNYVGLFGCVGTKTEGGVTTKGTVKNVGLEAINITGKDDVGGVVGLNKGGTVSHCYSTGSVKGSGTDAGGVVGANYDGTVTSCYSTATVKGSDAYTGGVVGLNEGGTVTDCYSTGDVTGSNMFTGGVVGTNIGNGTVTNCYSTGDVTGSGSFTGGVAGSNLRNSIVTNCYSAGSVSGSSYTGGVVGRNIDATLTNCYYNKSVCGNIGAINGADDASNVKGLTTAQMTGENALSNMTGFSDTDWLTKADGADNGKYYWYYPHLKGFDYDLTAASEDWPAKAEISVTWEEADIYTYNGQAQAPSVTSVTIGDTSVPEGMTVNYQKYENGQWKDIPGAPSTDPGNYKMVISSGDEELGTKYFAILEADSDYTVKYYKNPGDVWSSDSVYPIDAGDYKAVITFLKAEDNGVEYIPDESHAPIEKVFVIDPASVILTANSRGTDVYDGTEKTVSGFTSSEPGLIFSGVTASGSGTNAGAYAVTFSGVTINETRDNTGNYVVTGTENGILKIDPASVTLSANSGTEVYDGTEKTVSGFTSSVEGLTFDGVTASGSGTDAGDYDVTFSGVTTNETRDATGNYVVTGTENGTLTINPASVTLTANSGTENYDGTEKTVSGFTSSVEGLTFDGVTASGSGTEPGVYDVTFSGVTENETRDTAGNYVITGTADGTLTVNPVIEFVNEDGTVLQSSAVALGETPEYKGETPAKAETDEATYTFKGWSPEITAAEGNATYTATFTETKKEKPADDKPAAKAAIAIKGEDALTLGYKQNKTFTADTEGVPEGGKVQWYLNGEKAGEGKTFKVENPEDDYTLQSKIVDASGSTVAESETVKVTVKHGFFDKLKAWLTDLLLGVFAPLFSKFEEVC